MRGGKKNRIRRRDVRALATVAAHASRALSHMGPVEEDARVLTRLRVALDRMVDGKMPHDRFGDMSVEEIEEMTSLLLSAADCLASLRCDTAAEEWWQKIDAIEDPLVKAVVIGHVSSHDDRRMEDMVRHIPL